MQLNRFGLSGLLGACLLMASWMPAASAPAWMPQDIAPHAASMLEVTPGVRLEVLDFGGEGEPLVLLAGLGNSAHVFDDFAPLLAGRHRVYAITRRGFGHSDSPDHGYDIDTRVADDLAVLDALGLQAAVWIGHSIAGEELHVLAARHPDRVRAVVYLDAAFDQRDVLAFEQRTPPPLPLPAPAPAASPDGKPRPPTRFESATAARAWMDSRLRKHVPLGEVLATIEFADDGRVLRERGRPDDAADQLVASAVHADYAAIRRPALALFPPAPSAEQLAGAGPVEPWREFAQAGREFIEQQTRRLASEFKGVRIAQVADTNHYLFLGAAVVVAGEIEAFLETLAPTGSIPAT